MDSFPFVFLTIVIPETFSVKQNPPRYKFQNIDILKIVTLKCLFNSKRTLKVH